MNQIQTDHALPAFFFKIILILPSQLRLGLSSGRLPAGFPTKIPYALLCFLVFHMHYVC